MRVNELCFYCISPSWLALTREQRREKANELQSIVIKYPEVKVRFFDAEALPGRDYTDIILCETNDIQKYHFMWEELRDHGVYTNGHMKIKNVLMGIEEGYKSYESDASRENS